MQAAKDAVKKFTSKDGKHDTSVHETVAPAVTNETIHKNQKEHVTTALDREVHQDHYHTSVQPVKDSEILPEQHHHRIADVEHKTFNHNDHAGNKERLAQEAAQFKDTSRRVEGQHTTAAPQGVMGEHVHHHVHENIQPVVEKHTVEPHVVHTTIPVHETHHNAAQHHGTSHLPAVTLDEFSKSGGTLGGRGERNDKFEGCPKNAHTGAGVGSVTNGHGHNHGVTHTHAQGVNGNSYGDRDSELTNLHNQNGATTGAATAGTVGGANTTSTTGATHEKASFMDKLNPKKDSNHDGKAGIMS